MVHPYGGIKNRSGSRYVCEVKDSSKKVRLIPFSFSSSQTYVLEVGEGYIRMVTNGGQLTYGSTPPSAWLTATVYAVGNIRRNGGLDYYCKLPHTSGTFATDLAAGKWLLLGDSGSTGAILEVPTGYLGSDLPTIKYTQSADVLTTVHQNHAPSQLSRYSATTWTFLPQTLNYGPFQNINTDNTLAVWTSANVGTVTVSANRDLFRAKHVGSLFYMEQKDFGISWLPGVAVVLGDIRRSGNNYYKALGPGTTGQNIPVGTGNHWNDGGVDWQYLHAGFGVARIKSVESPTSATMEVISRLPDGTTTSGFLTSIVVTACAGTAEGYIDGTATAHGLTVGTYGVAKIVLDANSAPVTPLDPTHAVCDYIVKDTNTITFYYPRSSTVIEGSSDAGPVWVNYTNTVASFQPPAAGNNAASYKWAFGAFGSPAVGDATYGYGPGYPAAVTYYQQRLCFGGTPTAPDTLWTSKTGNYSDFGQTPAVQDSDSVVYSLGGNQVNAIRSLLQLNKLLIQTSGSLWATGSGQQSDVLTPSNINAKLQGYDGISDLPPLGVGGSVLYVQDKAQIVGDLSYQWATDAYAGQNLTARGSHLVDGHTIVDWTFQQAPLNVIWMVRDDGVLLGLTYLKDQQVAAWHRHDTDGLYESVCCVSEGREDVLYVVVKRTINGVVKRFIERFDTRVVTDIRDAFFVDCGLTMDNRNTTATTITLSGGTNYDSTELITLTASAPLFVYPGTSDVGDQIVYTDADGIPYQVTIESTSSSTVAHGRPLSTVPAGFRTATASWAWARNTIPVAHLEGKEIAVLADGYVVSPRPTVTGGVITLVNPAVRAQIGLPYNCDAETLPLAPNTQESVRGNYKLVNVLRVVVQETRSLWAGPDSTKLYEAKTRTQPDYMTPPNLISDVAEVRLNSTWERNGTTLIRHSDPTPVGLLALMPEVSIGGA